LGIIALIQALAVTQMDINQPRKHHYIPECYLKAFANGQKQLWKRNFDNNKTTICSPAQVGYEFDVNKTRTEEILVLNGLNDYYHVEKWSFEKQENNYTNILAKAIKFSDSSITIDKYKYRLFLETLLTIKRRNPATREIIINGLIDGYNSKETVPQFKAYLLEEASKHNVILEEGIDERIKNYIADKLTSPDRLHDTYLSAFIESSDHDTIINLTQQLYNLKQVILHPPLTTQFITSDNPGFTKTQEKLLRLGGFGSPFEFYFPLSPRACLYINSRTNEDRTIIEKNIYPTVVTESQVSEINQFTKSTSNKKLFGYNKSILEKV
jgi:hypothetical protein